MLTMHGRVLIVGAMCAFTALLVLTAPEQADAQGTATATAASACSHQAAFSHRGQGLRSLTSAQTSTLQQACTGARLSAYKLKFWYNPKHSWTLYQRQSKKKCWDPSLRLYGPVALCMQARSDVRVNSRKLMNLNSQIEEMTRPRLDKLLLAAFTCIHGKEGAWNANTGNGYYGGLQMDLDFQRLYGPEFLRLWGTADNWPSWAQMEAARRAYISGRGFGPWPNTHVACSLSTYLEV